MSENKTIRVNIGCGTVKESGMIGIDMHESPVTDIVMNLDDPKVNLGFGDSCVDEIQAHHFLEHIHNLFPLMNECWRILKPDGIFDIVVPVAPSRAAYDDPTHLRFFTKATFHYFTQTPPGNQVFPEITGKWDIVLNDWSPEFVETGDSIVIPDVRELHVQLKPVGKETKDDIDSNNTNIQS